MKEDLSFLSYMELCFPVELISWIMRICRNRCPAWKKVEVKQKFCFFWVFQWYWIIYFSEFYVLYCMGTEMIIWKKKIKKKISPWHERNRYGKFGFYQLFVVNLCISKTFLHRFYILSEWIPPSSVTNYLGQIINYLIWIAKHPIDPKNGF